MDGGEGRAWLAALFWLGSLAAAIVLFTAMGDGRLAAPVLTEPGTWADWAAGRDAAEITFALGRLGVLALGWYLAGVTTLGIAARWARSVRLLRVADALAVPALRHLLQASLGLGLATAAVASSTSPAMRLASTRPAGGPDVVATATDLVPAGAPTPVPTPIPGTSEDVPNGDVPLEYVPLEGPGDGSQPPAPPRTFTGHLDVEPVSDPLWHLEGQVPPPAGEGAAAPTAPDEPATEADATGGARTSPIDQAALEQPSQTGWYVVEPGDHFWSIAERLVSARLGRPADDDEIALYWRRLVQANRDRLVHADDPDLIHPGQRFVLPALSS